MVMIDIQANVVLSYVDAVCELNRPSFEFVLWRARLMFPWLWLPGDGVCLV